MKISILTLFPQMFDGPFSHSIIKRAIDKKLIDITLINIRDFGIGKHQIVDDTPYGGGAGMVLRVDVVADAIASARCADGTCKEYVVLLDAGGKTFSQKKAHSLATFDHLILICGHYEGIDYRITEYIDEEISIGDYVLTGGEIPAMVITDTVVRLLPTVLGKDVSSEIESFQPLSDTSERSILVEYPQYTKPLTYNKKSVPSELLSGHHKNIAEWRKDESIKRTKENRPDLLKKIS